MRGKAFLIIGIALTISNASGPTGATTIVAQEAPPASLQAPSTVALLPLPARTTESDESDAVEQPHEARPGSRILSAHRRWEPAPVIVQKSAPVPAVTRHTFLAVVDQPDIQERHKIIADEVLRLLPESCTNQLKNFYVRYDRPERRGLAGKSTIIMDGTLGDEEFRAVLIHEALGHVFDLGCLQGSPLAGTSMFKDGSEPIFRDDPSLAFYRISWVNSTQQRTEARPEDFVSGYAASDPFEDLAESVIYYILHNDAFIERARTNAALRTKLKWLQAFLPVQPSVLAEKRSAWNGAIPWDITKIAYTWKNPAIVARQ